MTDVSSQPELRSVEQSGDAARVTLATITVWLVEECSVLQTFEILWLQVEHVSGKSLL